MLLRVRLLPLMLLVVGAPALWAQSLDVRIRLHNEQVYFPDSQVQIAVTVHNPGATPQRFRIADDRRFSVNFQVRDTDSRQIEPSADLITARSANQVFYRDLTLQPGEEIRFVESLHSYVQGLEMGTFTVHAQFYPELIGNAGSLISNPISLRIRAGLTPEVQQEQLVAAVIEEQLAREALSPDQIVSFLIEARRQGNWDRFFLYLNLERLYRGVPSRERSYVRMSETDQIEALRTFRAELIDQSTDGDLSVVPDQFEIVQTSYTPNEGQVVARLYFDFPTYREVKRYTYNVERRDGFWEVVSFSVVNLANEALGS